jgi:hypothetical protein
MEKMMAAIGALKMEEMAAADAQDISTILDLKLICIIRPKLEPMAEPVLTEGPSSPTDPPKPTVKILVKMDPSIPFLLEIEYKTAGTPSPTGLLMILFTNKVSRIPIMGKTK